MKREVLSEKLMVIGVDGLDPKLTLKYMAEGIMPNTKKLIEAGSCREDLVMLGGHPTITPPMWTTMATGAYSVTHGITCFSRCGNDIDKMAYNIASRYCKAEQMWNVTAEAGKKTLVWHWPGSSWPPSSDSPNLSVVDGLTPACVNITTAVDAESMLVANVTVPEIAVVPRAAADSNIPCVIEKLESQENSSLNAISGTAEASNLLLYPEDGEHALSDTPFDVVLAPIKEPTGWQFEIPADAKETTEAWALAMANTATPTALILSRQNIADLPEGNDYSQAAKGAYIVAGSDKNPDVILVASGSEVSTLVAGAELLRKDGVKCSIVSVPSEGLFRSQCTCYQEEVLPAGVKKFGLTAGLPVNLQGLVPAHEGKVWGLESFGFSAPYKVLDEKLGFTAENVYNQVKAML